MFDHENCCRVSEAELLDSPGLTTLIGLSLQQDLGSHGDVTSRVVPSGSRARGAIVARAEGVLCGLGVAKRVFETIEPELSFTSALEDGAALSPGQVIATIEGNARAILEGERTALNFLQRLSGMASLTRRYAAVVAGSPARVYDTRKTIPGWRLLSKYAVVVGGGASHRRGLYDQVLIKDNHLALFGGETGVARAIAEAQRTAPGGTVIEVEVTGLEAALAAARAGADIILLDNMSCAAMAEVVGAIAALPAPRPALEASGGITLETLAEVAKTGVTRISVGALTHSALALDIALDVEIEASTKNP